MKHFFDELKDCVSSFDKTEPGYVQRLYKIRSTDGVWTPMISLLKDGYGVRRGCHQNNARLALDTYR
jgi:hypothetical protein